MSAAPCRPEATALYRAAGHALRFDGTLLAERVGVHAFEKELWTP